MDRLDEIIEALIVESLCRNTYTTEGMALFKQAAALLRAGAEMRKSKAFRKWNDACEAWDAVLKEDEG